MVSTITNQPGVSKSYVNLIASGAVKIQAGWNANTNTPDISGATNTGFARLVTVAGNTDLGGITDRGVGDLAIKSETGWVKLDADDKWTVSHVTSNVALAVQNTIYLVDASANPVEIKLRDVTAGDTAEYRIVLANNTHRVTVTTVGGTQLIVDKTAQVLSTVNGGLYLKASGTDHYDSISDTREYYRIIELTGAGTTDLSASGYENKTIYHCEPGTGNTRTIIVPDSTTGCYGFFAKFVLDGPGSVVLRTENNELISGAIEQTISSNGGFELTCFGDHYGITQDSRPKIQNSAITLYSLHEDSTIADGLGGFYKQSSTSTTDARYNLSTPATTTSAAITGNDILIFESISDEGVIQGLLPEGPAETILNLRKSSGIADFQFYVKFYKRNGAGTETLIGTSALSSVVSSAVAAQYSVQTNISETTFLSTDRIIRKIYANKVGVTTDPTAEISVEGPIPSFSRISAPATTISHNSMAGIQSAAVGITNGHVNNGFLPPRVTAITSSATPTINTDNCDMVSITALAAAITSMTTNLTGTPVNGQKLIFRIKDDGTARAITRGDSFEAKGVALPGTTVISKVLTVGFIYDTVTSKRGCVAVSQEA